MTAVLVTSIVAVTLGFLSGLAWRRHNPRDLEAKLKDAELRAKRAERHYEIERVNCNQAIELRHRAEAERDKALEIAKTHEVTLPDPGEIHTQTVNPWDKRQYNSTPEKNMQNIKDDLQKEFGNQHLKVKLVLHAQGGWVPVFQKHWRNRPITLTFDGPARRIAHEIWTFFNDLDHGFVAKSNRAANYGQKIWVDGDSPLTFEVTVEHEQEVPTPEYPEVHTVEVAVVRTEVVETEKLVIPEPDSLEGLRLKEQVAHEDLVALIDAVLETRETERQGAPLGPTKAKEIDADAERLARKLEARQGQSAGR